MKPPFLQQPPAALPPLVCIDSDMVHPWLLKRSKHEEKISRSIVHDALFWREASPGVSRRLSASPGVSCCVPVSPGISRFDSPLPRLFFGAFRQRTESEPRL